LQRSHDKICNESGGEWGPVAPEDFKSFVEALTVSGGFDSLSSPPYEITSDRIYTRSLFFKLKMETSTALSKIKLV